MPTVEEAENRIREMAAAKANELANEHESWQATSGSVFENNAENPQAGPYTLEFNDGAYHTLLQKGGEPLLDEFREFAVEGVHWALGAPENKENMNNLVGSIIGYAFNDLDYLEKFNAAD